ncbi:MAG: hypothetical protein AVO35_01215 [Candidatus Aegiribacteria sp. MLS_C]|nr:MAG: hypothetical protein AVO35_01215 [Candidatus Aegiribacteria sp. MLS_C]
MQLLLGILCISAGQGDLESYHLQIDPAYLNMLYQNPLEDLQFPAWVETPAGACSCLAGFRGGSSLFYPKKSWKLELFDTSLTDCSHLLLDAQYRDRTFMRNALGMLMSREMGLPAPLTRHVEFYVNGDYYGVYVQVERIDGFFYRRNGLEDGPLFKSVDHLGRMVWQPCDTSGTAGFEAERGWDEELPLLRHLIDLVNLGLPHGISSDDVITNTAIAMAIHDEDAISKNYYLHLTQEGEWRYYPWDRDATFGNRWNGEYNPDWVEEHSLFCFDISPLVNLMLRDGTFRQLYSQRMLQAAQLMAEELPGVMDSIYWEIRESVYADTMKNGSNQNFEDAVDILAEDLQERADYLPVMASVPSPIELVSMEFSRWDFPPWGADDSVTVTVELESPPGWAGITVWSDGNMSVHYSLERVGASGLVWSGRFPFPEWQTHVRVALDYSIVSQQGPCTYYYPAYGHSTSEKRRVCAPTARRSPYPAHHGDLEVLDPVRYNTFLWSLPLVNGSNEPLDLSFYGFQAGDPPARIFAPDRALMEPGDTLFLTNRSGLLKLILPPGSMVFGDLVIDSPSGTDLLVLDPSWQEALTVTVGNEVQSGESGAVLVLSEICHRGDAGDWIEFFNIGYRTVDLSGWVVLDGGLHTGVIPDGTTIDPGRFLVVCQDIDGFRSFYSGDIAAVEGLEFGLNGERDGILLMDGERSVLSVLFDSSSWPLSGDLMYLRRPDMPMEEPCSWQAAEMPGTPGAPNPGWPSAFSFPPVIQRTWPNPACCSIVIEYFTASPGEVSVYDLSGRMVIEPRLLGSMEGTVQLELEGLSTGVYFVVVRSMGATASSKIVVLRNGTTGR